MIALSWLWSLVPLMGNQYHHIASRVAQAVLSNVHAQKHLIKWFWRKIISQRRVTPIISKHIGHVQNLESNQTNFDLKRRAQKILGETFLRPLERCEAYQEKALERCGKRQEKTPKKGVAKRHEKHLIKRFWRKLIFGRTITPTI